MDQPFDQVPTEIETNAESLVANSDAFRKMLEDNNSKINKINRENYRLGKPLPTGNSIKHLLETKKITPEQIVDYAKSVRILVHRNLKPLLENFIEIKKNQGSTAEKSLYADMTPEKLIHRFLTQRAIVNFLPDGIHILQDGTIGIGELDKVGAEWGEGKANLKNCLSYDEAQLSSMIGISIHTPFINDGNRNNCGNLGEEGTYQPQGIYIGLTGARLELPKKEKEQMEKEVFLITREQNRPENGYGSDSAKDNYNRIRLEHLAKFYGLDYFPSYEEAKADYEEHGENSKYYKREDGHYFHKAAYKIRTQHAVVEPALEDANNRAKEAHTTAFFHAVGVGLGNWADGMSDEMGAWDLEVYHAVLPKYPLISDVH